jgi:hypothetical protein
MCLILTALLIVGPAAATTEGPKSPLTVSPEHQTCVVDIDCTIVELYCGDCDCGQPVNIKYRSYYLEQKKEQCAEYKGGVCDLACRFSGPVCRSGKCEISKKEQGF